MEVSQTQVFVKMMEETKFKGDDFATEMAKGFFWSEIDQKENQLKEYSDAFEMMEDKDSFNAQYVEVLIDNLKSEIRQKKKAFKI